MTTPRTDALAAKFQNEASDDLSGAYGEALDLCEQLERELGAASSTRAYCEACGYTDSHDPNCPRPPDVIGAPHEREQVRRYLAAEQAGAVDIYRTPGMDGVVVNGTAYSPTTLIGALAIQLHATIETPTLDMVNAGAAVWERWLEQPVHGEIVRQAYLAMLAARPASSNATIPVSLLRQHWLHAIECDHERKMDHPICACSLVDLGWHASVGAAVEAWLTHLQGVAPKP